MSILCQQVHEFAEGELDPLSARAFRNHLAECVACQCELHELLQLMAMEDELLTDRMDAMVLNLPGTQRGRGTGPTRGGGGTSKPDAGSASDRGIGAARIIPLSRYRKLGKLAMPMAAAAAVLLACAAYLHYTAEQRFIAEAPPGAGRQENQALSERLALALGRARSIEGRLSYAGADGYRPYDVPRAGHYQGAEPIPLSLMAAMEQRQDFHGVAAAELLRGNLGSARASLRMAPASADIACDRALLALLDGDPQKALLGLEPVLAAQPRHAQALWNQGLALQALGLSLEAARAFEAVAELGEPGWSVEARDRARILRRDVDARKQGWIEVKDAGKRMVDSGQPMLEAMVRDYPGVAREFFYGAVRAAQSAEVLAGLRPLAKNLDAHYHTSALDAYLDRAAAENPARRAALARSYARLIGDGDISEKDQRSLLDELRRAGQDDMLFGALVHIASRPDVARRRAGDELAILAGRLAARTGDPWYTLVAAEKVARQHLLNRDYGRAELSARQGLDVCETNSMDYRCGRLYEVLAASYIGQHLLSEARRYLVTGWERARRANDWNAELDYLIRFEHIVSMRDDVDGSGFALAKAYLSEYLHRIQMCGDCAASCPNWFYAHESLASILINQKDMDGARAQMERADSRIGTICETPPMTLQRAFVLSHLLRFEGADERVAELVRALDRLRTQADMTPGKRAIIDHIEGRLLIERAPETGRMLLDRAIATTAENANSDILAAKARAYSYSVLIQDASARGQNERALALIGEEAGAPMAERCVLGVAAEEALVVVARDADGTIMAERTILGPKQRVAAKNVVPARISAALSRCEVVDVHARSPYQGSATLLPPAIAWRYRLGRAHPESASRPRRTLVVSDIDLPPSLDLPALAPHIPVAAPDLHLRGSAATPSRVLAAMADATAIEIHAHGVMNLGISDAAYLVLSPDSDGDYALTAEMLRGQRLGGAPTVILGACHGAFAPEYAHGSTSLASAFIRSGARRVIASPSPISDAGAAAFFAGVERRIEQGVAAALALRDERMQIQQSQREWAEQVVVFE